MDGFEALDSVSTPDENSLSARSIREDEFEELLADAQWNKRNEWEADFLASLDERYTLYRSRMRISDKQLSTLSSIAER